MPSTDYNEGSLLYPSVANADSATGPIITMEPEEFDKVIQKLQDLLVIYAKGGFMQAKYKYLFSHKGLYFFTKSNEPLSFPSSTQFIFAKKISFRESNSI